MRPCEPRISTKSPTFTDNLKIFNSMGTVYVILSSVKANPLPLLPDNQINLSSVLCCWAAKSNQITNFHYLTIPMHGWFSSNQPLPSLLTQHIQTLFPKVLNFVTMPMSCVLSLCHITKSPTFTDNLH